MIFRETPFADAFVIEAERLEDKRGYFATEYSADSFRQKGLDPHVEQTAISFNKQRGTLRGLHFQAYPHGQAKLVRCLRGAVYDVILDLRGDSATFRQWYAIELTEDNNLSLYIPAGMAHGFETLVDAATVAYQFSSPRHEPSERGVRWDDPSIGLTWPIRPSVISARDASLPDLEAVDARPLY